MADGDRLAEDLSSAEFDRGVEQRFWDLVERKEWKVYVRLRAADERTYLAELDCTGYGQEPILCRFVDPESRHCVDSAWPQGDGIFSQWMKFSGSELFVCWDQDRDAIRRHPEWRERRAWTRKPNQIVAYVDFLRELLHLETRGYHRQCVDLD